MTVMEDDGTVTETKYYAGSYYEEICGNDGEVRKINYIFAGGKAVAIFETSNRAADLLRYVHHDHLGSVSAYTDENGNLVQELSYDAWGRRRNPVNWEYYSSTEDADAWHPRGFGGHEHLDVFDMVNMDGRMYDPILGRFLSPDPFVQAPDFTQSLNRYCYCLNNPLSLVDPSGYSWFSKNWKSLVAAAVGIAVGAVTGNAIAGYYAAKKVTLAALIGSTLGGAAGGAAGAMTGALLNGANIGQIAKATLIGGLIGGASGFLNYAAGDGAFLERLFKHTFATGWLEGIQGGNMLHGFMMGATSCAGGTAINSASFLGNTAKIAANAVLGGTVSEIGGGKFANGAITAAFSMMFNDMMHGGEYGDGVKKNRFNSFEIEERGGVYYLNGHIIGEKGLECIWPEFDILTVLRGTFNTIIPLFNANSKAITNLLSENHFTRIKGGVRQTFLEKTNIDELFNCLASRCNAKILRNGTERYFKAGKYRVGLHDSSRGGGRTIHINYNNGEKLYKIRTK